MQKIITTVNFVLVGRWNRKIFTPDWVRCNLFALSVDKEIEGVFDVKELDIGFKYKNISIMARTTLIEINIHITPLIEKDILTATEIVKKLLTILPHTPIKAMGFNVVFSFEKDKIWHIGILDKISKIIEGEPEISQIKFSTQTDYCVRNILADINKDSIVLNFNHHFDNVIKLLSVKNDKLFLEYFMNSQLTLKE